MSKLATKLETHLTTEAQALEIGERAWRLEIPPGPPGRYRLAQLDDYSSLPRHAFPWMPPFQMTLMARSCVEEIPGTWGFGLWNDPFAMGLLSGGGLLRLPVLPNAAWFFFASPPSYLSFRDDLPAQGFLAATFCSRHLSSASFVLGAPLLPLLILPPVMRFVRRMLRRLIHQDAVSLSIDPTSWHEYSLEWGMEGVRFWVDDESVLQTAVSPNGPLGLVLWVDNQYAALPPSGRFRYGMLPTQTPIWIEVSSINLTSGQVS